MVCDLEVVGQILTTLSAVVLGTCASAGVFLMPTGAVSLGGDPSLPNDERTRKNRHRYLRKKIGEPIGWLLFGTGSLAQLVATISR